MIAFIWNHTRILLFILPLTLLHLVPPLYSTLGNKASCQSVWDTHRSTVFVWQFTSPMHGNNTFSFWSQNVLLAKLNLQHLVKCSKWSLLRNISGHRYLGFKKMHGTLLRKWLYYWFIMKGRNSQHPHPTTSSIHLQHNTTGTADWTCLFVHVYAYWPVIKRESHPTVTPRK